MKSFIREKSWAYISTDCTWSPLGEVKNVSNVGKKNQAFPPHQSPFQLHRPWRRYNSNQPTNQQGRDIFIVSLLWKKFNQFRAVPCHVPDLTRLFPWWDDLRSDKKLSRRRPPQGRRRRREESVCVLQTAKIKQIAEYHPALHGRARCGNHQPSDAARKRRRRRRRWRRCCLPAWCTSRISWMVVHYGIIICIIILLRAELCFLS